jgi:hypothetical protein
VADRRGSFDRAPADPIAIFCGLQNVGLSLGQIPFRGVKPFAEKVGFGQMIPNRIWRGGQKH